jgi:hypothetical protein
MKKKLEIMEYEQHILLSKSSVTNDFLSKHDNIDNLLC